MERTLKYFVIKFIFRFFHLLSIIFIFGDTSYTLFFGKRDESLIKNYRSLTIISSFTLILGGLGNMITMIYEKDYIKDNSYKTWKFSLYLKFILSLLLSPILNSLVDNKNIDFYRFLIMFMAFIISVFIRYYREYYMKVEAEVVNKINFYSEQHELDLFEQ